MKYLVLTHDFNYLVCILYAPYWYREFFLYMIHFVRSKKDTRCISFVYDRGKEKENANVYDYLKNRLRLTCLCEIVSNQKLLFPTFTSQ